MTRFKSLAWSIATVLVAALVSYFVAREVSRDSTTSSTKSPSEQGFHDWLHENLAITQQQELLLRPHEISFEKNRNRIRGEIETAGRELAAAIRTSTTNSAKVSESRMRLTRLQGDLQQTTLDHFFAMKEHLNEEQGEKLLRWTHDSIIHGYHD